MVKCHLVDWTATVTATNLYNYCIWYSQSDRLNCVQCTDGIQPITSGSNGYNTLSSSANATRSRTRVLLRVKVMLTLLASWTDEVGRTHAKVLSRHRVVGDARGAVVTRIWIARSRTNKLETLLKGVECVVKTVEYVHKNRISAVTLQIVQTVGCLG
jgi:hypothetical protein